MLSEHTRDIQYTIRLLYDAVQPAFHKRTPLVIEFFYEKPSSDPPLKWEKWRTQLKLALLVKENITLHTLVGLQTENVQLPRKPIYDDTIQGSSAQSEWERKARNTHPEKNGENLCQRQIEIGIMCEDKPWNQGDRKTVSMIYLSIGTEGRRRINNSLNPHLVIDTLT